MGRSRKRRNRVGGRVTKDNANRRLIRRTVEKIAREPITRFQEIEDRRQWHPEKSNRPARSFNKGNHRLRAIDKVTRRRKRSKKKFKRKMQSQTKATIGFIDPDRVMVCVRRKIRQEVLHAFGKTGKGKKRRRPRFNILSRISCRRK